MADLKVIPKVLKRWREPVPVRKERFRRAWKAIPPVLLHLWWVCGLLSIAGGLGYMWHYEWGVKGDRGVVAILFGVFVLISRFAPIVMARFPGRVTITENGIVYSVKLLPSEVRWDRRISAQFSTFEAGGDTIHVLELEYDQPPGTVRAMLGIDTPESVEEIRAILAERGVNLP